VLNKHSLVCFIFEVSTLSEEKSAVVQIGGNIESALKGDYNIDVAAVLREGWQLTLASRLAINIGLIFVMLLGMCTMFVVSMYFGGVENVLQDQQASALANIIVTLVVYPFLVGVEMMGIFHAVGIKTHPRLVMAFLRRGSWVAITALLTSTLVALGLNLLIVPGIFLIVALSLVLPLVVEKRLSPLKAIALSVQTTRFQWFKLFSIYGVLLGVFVLLTLPIVFLSRLDMAVVGIALFIFGMTYLAPWFYNVKGILYREIYGMQLSVSSSGSTGNDNYFAA